MVNRYMDWLDLIPSTPGNSRLRPKLDDSGSLLPICFNTSSQKMQLARNHPSSLWWHDVSSKILSNANPIEIKTSKTNGLNLHSNGMAGVELTSENFTKAASSMLKKRWKTNMPETSSCIPIHQPWGSTKIIPDGFMGAIHGPWLYPMNIDQLHPVELPGRHHSLHHTLPCSPPLRIAHISFLAKFPHHCANAIPGQPSPTKNTGKSVRLPGSSWYI